MNSDDKLRSAYQGLITRPASGRAGCPPPEALDALASRQGGEEARLTTLNHAMTCTECRRELDLLRAVQGGAPAPAPRWRPQLFALAATVMLAVGAILVWNSVILDPAEELRGGEAQVGLVEPFEGARVAGPPRLVWRAVPEATGYRLEVLDSLGAVVATGMGPDTTLQLPADALPPSQSAYRWRVIAELRTGGTLSSTVRRFELTVP